MTKFKRYEQDQILLLPPSLEELIGQKELVRKVDEVIGKLDLSWVGEKFSGGGCPSYHPLMMLKVLVYAYCCKLYSCRMIAKALKRDVAFMWLSGMQKPDFNTVNRFRGEYLKDVLEKVFVQTVEFLLESGHIRFEDYFIDGTKMEADASKNSYVWKKNTKRYKERIRPKISKILEEVEEINRREDQQYEGKDLPEWGEQSQVSALAVQQTVDRINKSLQGMEGKHNQQLQKKVKQLQEQSEKLAKYEEQEHILGNRNSYSKTDTDATFMRMKNEELRAGYNVQAATENGFIAGFSISQNANDGACLKVHMERQKQLGLPKPQRMVADAGYGNEENYSYLEDEKIENFVKYPDGYKEDSKEAKYRFHKSRFKYESGTDSFICPEARRLIFKEEKQRKTILGYTKTLRRYECESCQLCPVKVLCTKSPANRIIETSLKLTGYQQQARRNLLSELGQKLRKRRGPEVETVFGDLKHNQRYRRIRLRGLPKAITEMSLVFIGYNLRKLFNQPQVVMAT